MEQKSQLKTKNSKLFQLTFFQRFPENQAIATGNSDWVEQRLLLQVVIDQRNNDA